MALARTAACPVLSTVGTKRQRRVIPPMKKGDAGAPPILIVPHDITYRSFEG